MEAPSFKPLIDRAYSFDEAQQSALEQGHITEEEWYDNHTRHFTEHYLASDNPRGQSGHSGDEQHYFHSHLMIINAIHKDGTFIDVGCANGYLMESLARWTQALGCYSIDWYGLDISEELIALAAARLPEWRERLFVGNALYWTPPIAPYDFVCVKELGYVPAAKQQMLFEHLLHHCLAPNGRLILGPYSEERQFKELEMKLTEWGYRPSGYFEKSHPKHPQLARRLLWFDRS
ncbi:class I SAM-dependent methyltransferase [Paenibacillus sp. PR3]|uniref:Class I SAM-dependent methyltransferase n=1 Tax=Paenibacillus terricola TaxID=2763503 RepID=A0ABR8MY37_9BACL|nr:class I SAM-dependent methyltransferase [Paenibacillus terricola]MBD3919845.1 class I SAM-dependent methyltransferase [Paenibacillus terricola]